MTDDPFALGGNLELEAIVSSELELLHAWSLRERTLVKSAGASILRRQGSAKEAEVVREWERREVMSFSEFEGETIGML